MERLSLSLLKFSAWLLPKVEEVADDATRNVHFILFLSIFIDVTEALVYLHGRGIRHCDINPANILLGFYDVESSIRIVAKVGDFGVSRKHPPAMIKEERGSPAYMAPELISDDGMMTPGDCQCDVYSFGLTMIETLTGKRPGALTKTERHTQWRDLSLKLSCQNCRDSEPCNGCFRLIADNCMNFVPSNRPTAGQLLTQLKSLTRFFQPDELNRLDIDRSDLRAQVFRRTVTRD